MLDFNADKMTSEISALRKWSLKSLRNFLCSMQARGKVVGQVLEILDFELYF